MTVIRRATKSEMRQAGDRVSVESLNRLARFAGRVVLWGCVLLLLVRGIASYFDTTSRVPTTTRGVTVTVTQPAGTETSQAGRK